MWDMNAMHHLSMNFRQMDLYSCICKSCCWRRLLRVPWTARRSNQSILKEISLEYLLEGLMLKLKLQYFGHLMQKANSFEKTLMLGKIEGGKRRGGIPSPPLALFVVMLSKAHLTSHSRMSGSRSVITPS